VAPKRRAVEPADWRLAGVKLTLSRKCRNAAVDPKLKKYWGYSALGAANPNLRLARLGSPICGRAAEELYRIALSIAEEQEAKHWELRAAASPARLRCDQGRHAEARDLLAPVYGWFTEGFDTPDLKEAVALLDTLDGP